LESDHTSRPGDPDHFGDDARRVIDIEQDSAFVDKVECSRRQRQVGGVARHKFDRQSPLSGCLPRRVEEARLAIEADYPAARPDLRAQQIKNPQRSAADVYHRGACSYTNSFQELPGLVRVHLRLVDEMLNLAPAMAK
jgi:hypothetical protein